MALTTNGPIPPFTQAAIPSLQVRPIVANAKVYSGALVAVQTAGGASQGYLANVTGADNSVLVAGVSLDTYDNTGGAAAAVNVQYRQGQFILLNSSGGDAILESSIPCVVYAADNQTVALTNGSNTRPFCGIAVDVSAAGVTVDVRLELSQQYATFGAIGIPLPVNQGGTGRTSATAYGPVFGGTTSTAALQSSGAGTAGQPLLSGGASAVGAYGGLTATGVHTAADSVFGIPFALTVDLINQAANTDIAVPVKCDLVSVQVIKSATAGGGAGPTVQVKDEAGTDAITNAIDLNISANTVTAPTTLDVTKSTIAAGQHFRIVQVQGGHDSSCRVILNCLARA